MQKTNSFICNICQGITPRDFGVRSDQRQVIACSDCGMGVLKEIPEDTSIFYVGDYYTSDSEHDGYSNYDYTASHSLLWVRHAIEYFTGSKKLLDIGAANGFLLSQLGDSYQKYGIEVNEKASAQAKANSVEIISSDIYETPARYKNFFDVVTSIATYEHVTDFRKAVEASLKLLKKNGVLIFEVPLISETQDSSVWYRTSLEHVYYPTVSGLTELFRLLGVNLAGFETAVEGFGTTYIGVVTRTPEKKLLADRLIDVLTEDNLALLSDDERSINVAFKIVHSFSPTSDGILALPQLIERGINTQVMSRLTQLWHNDFMDAYRLRVKNAENERAIDGLRVEAEQAENYARRASNALAAFAVQFKDSGLIHNKEFDAISELVSTPSPGGSCATAEAGDRLIKLNQKLLPFLIQYQQLEDSSNALTHRLAATEQQLSDVVTSTSWRATARLRSILTRYPRLKRPIRRSMKVLWWIRNGTFLQHMKLYLEHRRTRSTAKGATAGSGSRTPNTETAGLHVGDLRQAAPLVQFVPALSVVMCVKPDGMTHAVSSLLECIPSEWELVIAGAPEVWKLSHPLLRYASDRADQNTQICFDDLTKNTFGRLVAYVGTCELKQLSSEQLMELRQQTLEAEMLPEVTKLNRLLSESAKARGDLHVQRLWRRPQ